MIELSKNGTAAPPRFPITRDPEVVVVGAGPAGCATSLAYALRGVQVLQIESQPEVTQRLAGEWMHPSAVKVLRRLGIASLPGARAAGEKEDRILSSFSPAARTPAQAGQGFAVFPNDDEGPVLLSYSNGDSGLTCHHADLVTTLRSAVAAHPGIHFLSGTRVLNIEGQHITFSWEKRAVPVTLRADIIVGADGRSSVTRRFLRVADNRVLLSYMAGLLFEDAELPCEGFGHVFLGGPGPIFVYRIGPRHVRACLDVPLSMRRAMQEPDILRSAYGPAMPRELRGCFHRAISERNVTWAANQRHARVHYGRKGLALVGDAVGHFHPLTATGLTIGLRDGWYLAHSKSICDYQSRRRAECYVPGLLADTLYQLFTLNDPGTQALKRGVIENWRQSPGERRRAMRLIAGDEPSPAQFHQAFLNALMRALRRTLRPQVFPMHWSTSASTLRGFGSWLKWLALPNGLG